MKLREPIILSRGQLMALALVTGLGMALTLCVMAFIIFRLNDITRDRANDNRGRIAEVERIQRLEQPPTDAEIAKAAEHALEVCARTPSCRRKFLLLVRREVVRRITRNLDRHLREAVAKAIRPVRPSKGGGAHGGGNHPGG